MGKCINLTYREFVRKIYSSSQATIRRIREYFSYILCLRFIGVLMSLSEVPSYECWSYKLFAPTSYYIV